MVFIISVMVAIAVPAFLKVLIESRASAVANDFRVFTAAFQTYVHEKGDWPPDASGPGAIPPGMETYLGPTGWSRVTPIGGHYQWAPNTLQQGQRYRAAITISTTDDSTVSADLVQLVELDRKIDDGNLDTGNFCLGFRNYPVFVLEH